MQRRGIVCAAHHYYKVVCGMTADTPGVCRTSISARKPLKTRAAPRSVLTN